jgi:hypothetical protein
VKAYSRLGVAAAIGLIVASGSSVGVRAQQAADIATAPFGNYNPFISGGPPALGMPVRGVWAEVINVTPKWIVVQNESGQQFPIAADRVRQFLIRWPLPSSSITPQSMLEVTGSNDGSNILITDHLDVFEQDAQSLVSPTVNNLFGDYEALTYGNFQTLSSYGTATLDPFGMGPFQAAMAGGGTNPVRKHVVGYALANDPIQVAGFGLNWYTIQPSLAGMSITQVTHGSNSFVRRGDLVYVVPENLGPRSVDVSQLVLYKKMPVAQFQP